MKSKDEILELLNELKIDAEYRSDIKQVIEDAEQLVKERDHFIERSCVLNVALLALAHEVHPHLTAEQLSDLVQYACLQVENSDAVQKMTELVMKHGSLPVDLSR